MLGRTVTLASALTLVLLSACAVDSADGDEEAASANALAGNVEDGKVVKTVTDGLRLRRAPSKEDAKNIIGLLPIGTRVKIVKGAPTSGFYNVEVLSTPIRNELAVPNGWVFGDYLTGRAQEPVAEAPAENESRTGTHDVPTEMKVHFKVTDCSTLKDDKGKPMAPTVDDFLMKSGVQYAVLGIDTNTFSYGMRATIKEIDAPSSFNPGGRKVPLKIVKTATRQPDGPFTITLCADSSATMTLPTDDGMLNLSVYPN